MSSKVDSPQQYEFFLNQPSVGRTLFIKKCAKTLNKEIWPSIGNLQDWNMYPFLVSGGFPPSLYIIVLVLQRAVKRFLIRTRLARSCIRLRRRLDLPRQGEHLGVVHAALVLDIVSSLLVQPLSIVDAKCEALRRIRGALRRPTLSSLEEETVSQCLMVVAQAYVSPPCPDRSQGNASSQVLAALGPLELLPPPPCDCDACCATFGKEVSLSVLIRRVLPFMRRRLDAPRSCPVSLRSCFAGWATYTVGKGEPFLTHADCVEYKGAFEDDRDQAPFGYYYTP